MDARFPHVHRRRVERLRVNLPIHRTRPQLTEPRRHRRVRQFPLLPVPAQAHIVAMVGIDSGWRTLGGGMLAGRERVKTGEQSQQHDEDDRASAHEGLPPGNNGLTTLITDSSPLRVLLLYYTQNAEKVS